MDNLTNAECVWRESRLRVQCLSDTVSNSCSSQAQEEKRSSTYQSRHKMKLLYTL